MELTFLDFIKYDYTSLLLVCGLVVLMVTNRKNKLPAVFTLWIMTAIMIFSLFVEFVCKWSENDPSLADIRYWTTIIKYLISPTLLMMQCMVLVENKVLRGLLVIPNLISMFAVTAGPYVTGLTVLSFSKEYYFVEGPLRAFPFAVALFYLFVLVIVSLWFFFDVTSGYNSIIMFLTVATVISCILEYFGIVNGIVKYVQIIDIYLYYFFLNFVYQSRIREESLKQELALTQKELELSNTNVRLLQNQISPHFIYNALFIIKALIWTDQKQASDAVDDFSLYIRRNIEAMRSNELIPFSEMTGWYVDHDGSLKHNSGRFFTIQGIHVETDYGHTHAWDQPIINQPEIGYLGILTKVIDGTLYFLMQAKIEPGNVNCVQISPTLQATKSNYTQVHKGKKPAYLDYFVNVKPDHVLLDQLQSEQGARFLRKRNRNIIILVDEEIW